MAIDNNRPRLYITALERYQFTVSSLPNICISGVSMGFFSIFYGFHKLRSSTGLQCPPRQDAKNIVSLQKEDTSVYVDLTTQRQCLSAVIQRFQGYF